MRDKIGALVSRPGHDTGNSVVEVDRPPSSASGQPHVSEYTVDLQVGRLLACYAISRQFALVIAEHAYGAGRQA